MTSDDTRAGANGIDGRHWIRNARHAGVPVWRPVVL